MKPRIALALAGLIAAAFFALTRGTDTEGAHAVATAVAPAESSESRAEPSSPPHIAAVVEPESYTQRNPVAAATPAQAALAAEHAGILLYGFVLPVAGSESLALPAVHLSLTDHLGETRRAEAKGDGEYSFENLAPGMHWLVAQSRFGAKVRATVELDAAARERRLDVRLVPELDVVVEVTDPAGEPIPNLPLIAVATLEAPGEWFEAVSGSPNNTFGVGAWTTGPRPGDMGLPEILGRIRLTMPPPLYVSLVNQQRVVSTQRIEAEQRSVLFVLDPANPLVRKSTLRFRLVDAETRAPLPEVQFDVSTSGPLYSEKTRPDGTFKGPAWPGWLSLYVRSDKYERSEVTARAEAGVETDLGDISIASAVSISGQVLDDSGSGSPGLVYYEAIGTSLHGGSIRFGVQVSSDGMLRIDGLSRRRYRLSFAPEATNMFAIRVLEVDARAGSVKDVRIELARGIVLAIRASDDRWPLVQFDVIDETGVPIVSSRLFGPEPHQILLAPGRYEIESRIAGVVERTRRSVTISNDPVELSLP